MFEEPCEKCNRWDCTCDKPVTEADSSEFASVMPLTFEDFNPINFGILIAKHNTHEFIFQRPMPGDNKRAAQNGCVLFIDHKQQPVEEIEHALRIINDFIGAP